MTNEPRLPAPDIDAAAVQRLARLAGLKLTTTRAERLIPDLAALIEADRRLTRIDLGSSAATCDPWGWAPTDD
jgi:Asp-tRNA(Asn)/Glu-tRNA(Gln) amidotransferase C subunit